MGLTNAARRLRGLPGVLKARHLAEVTVTPHLRGELAEVRAELQRTQDRMPTIESAGLAEIRHDVARLDASIGPVLAAITSTNGAARLLRREFGQLNVRLDALEAQLRSDGLEAQLRVDGLEAQLPRIDGLEAQLPRIDGLEAQLPRIDGLEAQLPRIDGLEAQLLRTDRLEAWVVAQEGRDERLIELWRDDLAPHVVSIGFLLERVELIRAEVLNELRYGGTRTPAEPGPFEARIVRPEALEGDIHLNLGSGHIALPGYANVDMRALPGVDVVALLDHLPVEKGTVAEIFSSHVLEHFPREQLVRSLLPYWTSLLRPGGVFRAIVPDLEAMVDGFTDGSIDLANFREVVYGGQEYEGDTHYTGFTAADLVQLLADAGLTESTIVATGRANGKCLELEVSAVKPNP